VLPLGSAAFLLFGVVLVVLGACHSGLTSSLGLDHTAFGWLGSALSAGIAGGVLVGGPLVDRHPRRRIFLASTLIVATAMGSVGDEMSFARTLVHVAAMGAGAGVFDTLLNAVTVERWGDRSVRPMAWLHAMVPVGAMATPWLVHETGGAAGWVGFFRLVALAFLVLSVWAAFVPLPSPSGPDPDGGDARGETFLRPAFLALCGVAIAYIGIEAALTLFAVPYATGGLGLEEAHGQRAISAVWLGILTGRLLMMWPSARLDARAIVVEGAIGAVLIASATVLRLGALELVMAVCGLALAGVFPLMIALAGRLVPDAPGRAVGLVAGLGSIGGFAIPPLTGAIADASSIAVAMGSLAGWCGLIAAAGLVAHASSGSRSV
jgi:fucose permease